MVLHEEPEGAQGVLLLADGGDPGGRQVQGQLDVFLKDEVLVLLPHLLVLCVDRPQQIQGIDPALVLRHADLIYLYFKWASSS